MTRQLEDLRAVWRTDEDDVCSADELLARVARTVPAARRRRAVLAVAAAVVIVAGVVATIVATRPDHAPAPHAVAGPTARTTDASAIPTHTATPTPTPSASPTSAPRPTRLLDLGDATARIPVSWHEEQYRGPPTSLGSADLFLSTRPFTGVCATGAKVRSTDCLSSNWFPPGTRTPRDGLLVMWGHSHAIGLTGNGLGPVNGTVTSIDGRRAKLYAGTPTQICPIGTSRQIEAHIRATSSQSPTERLDTVACLGPAVSTADTAAVYAMLRSLRISG